MDIGKLLGDKHNTTENYQPHQRQSLHKQEWWYLPMIPALRKLRQEDLELQPQATEQDPVKIGGGEMQTSSEKSKLKSTL